MPQGVFLASQDVNDPRSINIQTVANLADQIPADQAKLRAEVEKAATHLRAIFPPNNKQFDSYFTQLVALAQGGLAGPNANPTIASQFLEEWKYDIVVSEGPRVKVQYMRALLQKALLFGLGPALMGICFYLINSHWNGPLRQDISLQIRDFTLVWFGCMIGAWISFGARKPKLAFEDIAVLEEDQLTPGLRLIFVGIMTMVFTLLFFLQVVTLKIGPVSTTAISHNPYVSVLVGVLCGLAEKLLPGKLLKESTKFFSV